MEAHNVVLAGAQTKEKFIRDSLIQLYSASDAPETIDAVELSEVNESTYQFLACNGEFDVKFTAEIGYDRKEQYLDEVREYNKELQTYITRTVIKERTVTDWRPYDSASHQTAVSLIDLDDNDTVDYGDLAPETEEQFGYYAYSRSDVVGDGIVVTDKARLSQTAFTTPNEHQMAKALGDAMSSAEFNTKLELPGDKNRNFRPNTTATDATFFVYAVNRFKTSFQFRDKTHFIKQFTTESQPSIYCSARFSDKEANDLASAERNAIASDEILQVNKKRASYATYAGFGLLCVAFLFAFLIPTFSMFVALLLGAIACFVVGSQVFSKTAKNRENAIRDKFKNEQAHHFQMLQEKKIALLNARFDRMGLEPLTQDELAYFSKDNKHQLDANYNTK